MKRFPVFSHDAVVCFNCQKQITGGRKSGYPDGAFVADCPACTMHTFYSVPVRTMAGWSAAGVNLDKYLHIGDAISEDLMIYFLETLPPATWRSDLIQIGEPFSHVNGRATFSTIYRNAGNSTWLYGGHCHRGEATEPAPRISKAV